MLTESFIASSLTPPSLASTSTNSTLLKDAGIFLHTHQPTTHLTSTYKKSQTSPNCLALSSTHIFAAQANASTLHVYNIAKGNQEATIPFRVRIHSIAICCADSVLALGTEAGAVILWEIHTGRQVSTSAAHLAPVTRLVVDAQSNFLLSGSDDANVLVWSLLDLLAFPSSSAGVRETIVPRHTLSTHRGGITALAIGHGGASASGNIALSGSKDGTVIVWDYISGAQLRTFLLPSVPLCLELDAADRAFYAGFEDGGVQLVDFYAQSMMNSINTPSTTPIQPPASSRWAPRSGGGGTTSTTEPSGQSQATLSLTLSHSTTTLLTSHANGTIQAWDTATGSFLNTIATYTSAPITNIKFLPPTGWPATASQNMARSCQKGNFKAAAIVKPKLVENDALAGGYNFSAILDQPIISFSDDEEDDGGLEITKLLENETFSAALLQESILELATWDPSSTSINPTTQTQPTQPAQADFMSLDGASDQDPKAQIKRLERQVEHLKSMQRESGKTIERLAQEVVMAKKTREVWRRGEDEEEEDVDMNGGG